MIARHIALVVCLAAATAACEKPTERRNVERNVGRYAFFPASAEMPAVLLDTRTGCLEQVQKLTAAENPQDVSWVRSYLDDTAPSIDKSGPTPKVIPDSAPPQRCRQAQGQAQ